MEEGDEWEQWQDAEVDISSSDDGAAASESDDSMYSGGAGGVHPRTRARRQGRRRNDKQPRRSSDHRDQRARKRQKLQQSHYAEDMSDLDEDDEEMGERLQVIPKHLSLFGSADTLCWPPCTVSCGALCAIICPHPQCAQQCYLFLKVSIPSVLLPRHCKAAPSEADSRVRTLSLLYM